MSAETRGSCSASPNSWLFWLQYVDRAAAAGSALGMAACLAWRRARLDLDIASLSYKTRALPPRLSPRARGRHHRRTVASALGWLCLVSLRWLGAGGGCLEPDRLLPCRRSGLGPCGQVGRRASRLSRLKGLAWGEAA